MDHRPKCKIADKLNFIKFKSAVQKTVSSKLEKKPGGKYLQKTCMIKDCYPKYANNT